MQNMEKLFYLFFNSISGGNRGQQLLKYDELKFDIKNIRIRVKIFNIFDEQSREKGLNQIKQDKKDAYIVMAGGDGSIMWIVSLLIKHEIEISQCIIIPFPFGTGNDFANTLGWGTTVPTDILGKNNSVLQSYVEQWIDGAESYFDVWDVDIQLQKDGYIGEIKRHQNGVGEIRLPNLQFNKQMINYFSIGVDARIGYGFDKNRTTNQCCNKCIYCWEGFKKMFVKTPKVNQSIDTLEYMDDDDNMQNRLLFKTKENSQQRDSLTIPGNPVNLLCLNINSYAGGLRNIWLNAQYENGYRKQNTHPPSFSDGVLEFLSFNSILGIGSERLIPGQATRLSQTKGPIKLNFRQNDPLKTYFQVDGQYYSIQNPISVSIRPCQQLPEGKIRVKVNKLGIVQQ